MNVTVDAFGFDELFVLEDEPKTRQALNRMNKMKELFTSDDLINKILYEEANIYHEFLSLSVSCYENYYLLGMKQELIKYQANNNNIFDRRNILKESARNDIVDKMEPYFDENAEMFCNLFKKDGIHAGWQRDDTVQNAKDAFVTYYTNFIDEKLRTHRKSRV